MAAAALPSPPLVTGRPGNNYTDCISVGESSLAPVRKAALVASYAKFLIRTHAPPRHHHQEEEEEEEEGAREGRKFAYSDSTYYTQPYEPSLTIGGGEGREGLQIDFSESPEEQFVFVSWIKHREGNCLHNRCRGCAVYVHVPAALLHYVQAKEKNKFLYILSDGEGIISRCKLNRANLSLSISHVVFTMKETHWCGLLETHKREKGRRFTQNGTGCVLPEIFLTGA